ncbi:MAG: RepB family DNA primase [Metallibacterium scheffleri]|jgi:hypothetical protein|uniref:DNA-primase RepB domain-containing protein n=1 Tax=Metallibacterium scheffleri TaxID=993689 RepID=UPI0026F09296|nr:DNA-primase RepB domain-containing protein [Metallibacterium scheffleri]MCK9367397.1 RepB family DNA primase [Metallibacterium scheffleri]
MSKDQSTFTQALDAAFAVSATIDLAFSRDDGDGDRIWLRPDAAGGRWARLGNLDRAGVQAVAGEAWARNLGAERWGVHWRPVAPAALVLLDDLDDDDADAIASRYKALIVSTSAGSNQAWLACDRPLTRLEQHAVQSELVHRLNASGRRRADPGACAGGQFGRLPGFRHPGHAGQVVDAVGRPWAGAGLLDAAALILSRETRLVDASSPAAAVRGRASPCSPRGPRAPRSGDRGKGAIPARPLASASEADFRFACNAIRGGDNAESIISALATSALSRGKRRTEDDARGYATRTYNAAGRAVRGQPEPQP